MSYVDWLNIDAGMEVTVPKTDSSYAGFNGVGYIVISPSTGEGAYMISSGDGGAIIAGIALYGIGLLLAGNGATALGTAFLGAGASLIQMAIGGHMIHLTESFTNEGTCFGVSVLAGLVGGSDVLLSAFSTDWAKVLNLADDAYALGILMGLLGFGLTLIGIGCYMDTFGW